MVPAEGDAAQCGNKVRSVWMCDDGHCAFLTVSPATVATKWGLLELYRKGIFFYVDTVWHRVGNVWHSLGNLHD